MDNPVNTFDLSPEQQDTANLLQRLLGNAIADRYVDFCRLAAGAFALRVSIPMAAHAMRELDSMLRTALEVPMEAQARKTPPSPETVKKIRDQFDPQEYDDAAITLFHFRVDTLLQNLLRALGEYKDRAGFETMGHCRNLIPPLAPSSGPASGSPKSSCLARRGNQSPV